MRRFAALIFALLLLGSSAYAQTQLIGAVNVGGETGGTTGVLNTTGATFEVTYGHIAGDAALVTVAKTLSNCLRASDVVGRWGGDEFMAILPGITREALAKASDKFRGLVAQSTVPVDSTQIRVTISVGAAIVAPGDSPESLLKRADQHLYTSKQSGRNRISL
jgi:diguanylate cyclase (GGDEF)-like protein